MKKISFLFLVFLFITQLGFSQKSKSLDKHLSPIDTFNYSEVEYEEMRTAYLSNQKMLSQIDRLSEEGNLQYIQLKKLIRSPYEKRYESGFNENQIKSRVYANVWEKHLEAEQIKLFKDIVLKLEQSKLENQELFEEIQVAKFKKNSDSLKLISIEIKKLSALTLNYMDSLKNEMLLQTGGELEAANDALFKSKIVEKIIFDDKEGEELVKRLDSLIINFNQYFNKIQELKKEEKEGDHFYTLTPDDNLTGKNLSFLEMNFRRFPLISTISYLSVLQTSIAQYENELLKSILSSKKR